jgi:hypothetical protein
VFKLCLIIFHKSKPILGLPESMINETQEIKKKKDEAFMIAYAVISSYFEPDALLRPNSKAQ